MKKTILILSMSLAGLMIVAAQTSPMFPDKVLLTERVTISGLASGEIEKEVLLHSKGLSLSGKSSSMYHVTSFRMTLVTKEGATPKEFSNEVNGELTPAMLDAIRNAPAESKVLFEYIKCSGPNNTTRSIHYSNFILK